MIAPAPTEEEAVAIFAALAQRPTAPARAERPLSSWRLAARDPELTFDDIRARTRRPGVL